MTSSFDLARFLAAQRHDGTYPRALAELTAGRKTSHWMWFVFPQIAGLGRSPTARRFAIASLAEAQAYLAHPILGPRLGACCQALIDLPTKDPVGILGEIDAMKLRSSMTLFARADPNDPRFRDVLAKYFAGETDPATEELL
jgi:uncharacterized protein (DUF1810 family)